MLSSVPLSEKIPEKRLLRDAVFLRELPRHLKAGQLTVAFPDGEAEVFTGHLPAPAANIRVHTLKLVARLRKRGVLGFLEGYVAEEWDTPDLATLLYVLRVNEGCFLPHLMAPRRSLFAPNIMPQSFDFYEKWLDRTMNNASALFVQEGEAFEQSHRHALQRIITQAGIKKEQHILEVSNGFAAFAVFAAQTVGCKITVVIMDDARRTAVLRRIKTLNLSHLITVLPHLSGRFDHVVCIEALPVLGAKKMPAFLKQLKQALKPQGKLLLQTPLIENSFLAAHLKTDNFVRRYIYPKGDLPSITSLEKACGTAYLAVEETFFFGGEYAKTFREWRLRFESVWLSLQGYNYTERFRRSWLMYFALAEACFLEGRITVAQFTLTHSNPQW